MLPNRKLRHYVLGHPLRNDQLRHEKLSVVWGLPVMASDAVSSVAYAVEEILLALVPVVGLGAYLAVGSVSIPILLLLMILAFSYTQIINQYPNGGGAYIVAMDNFGRIPALLAAAALVVDYIMTVAVSISSSTQAIVAAMPAWAGLAVPISVGCLALVTLFNLRGVSESAKIFGLPTYAFILAMGIMILVGLFKVVTGSLHPINYSADQLASAGVPLTGLLQSAGLLLILKAFASGCSALTGVEAVSNAVPIFKDPAQRTAKRVLFLLAATIIFIFGGTSLLMFFTHVIALPQTTGVAQMAQSIFGRNVLFYFVQITTSLILLLAANTAFNGLPQLLAILAKDRYVPHQFAARGTKLSFSNGILFILVIAGLLLVIFKADTHRLIPMYAVGVFVSFTLSQAGMVVRWFKVKGKGWHYKAAINGIGAVVTAIGSIVVFVTKFIHGAWILAIAIPLLILLMFYVHRHYVSVEHPFNAEECRRHYRPSVSEDMSPCIVLTHNLNRSSIKALNYANLITKNVTSLYVSSNDEHTERLKRQWKEAGLDIPLHIISAPYRDILSEIDAYVYRQEQALERGQSLTVVLTKFVETHWYDTLLHNQTAYFLERHLSRHPRVVTALVPFIDRTRLEYVRSMYAEIYRAAGWDAQDKTAAEDQVKAEVKPTPAAGKPAPDAPHQTGTPEQKPPPGQGS